MDILRSVVAAQQFGVKGHDSIGLGGEGGRRAGQVPWVSWLLCGRTLMANLAQPRPA